MIKVENLTKRYAGQPAIQDLNFEVGKGEIMGFLGPNGAGKSTTVKILATLSRADTGTAEVAGYAVDREPDAVRRAIGLVSQKASSDPMATGRENLVLAGRIQGMTRSAAARRADELLTRFRLSDAADRLVKSYSGGMTRKLDVAIGLVHRPRVLFLDEPTTGLDPEARAELWAEIARLSTAEEVTVLLTTHYLDEADQLADRLAIVDAGRVVAQGDPEQLKSELRGDTVHLDLRSASDATTAAALLERTTGLREVFASGPTLRARADNGARAVPAVLSALERRGIAVESITVARPSLDDVYLRHAGRAYEEA
jgi:ABC-2 type transport system ATP-binding protein